MADIHSLRKKMEQCDHNLGLAILKGDSKQAKRMQKLKRRLNILLERKLKTEDWKKFSQKD